MKQCYFYVFIAQSSIRRNIIIFQMAFVITVNSKVLNYSDLWNFSLSACFELDNNGSLSLQCATWRIHMTVIWVPAVGLTKLVLRSFILFWNSQHFHKSLHRKLSLIACPVQVTDMGLYSDLHYVDLHCILRPYCLRLALQ